MTASSTDRPPVSRLPPASWRSTAPRDGDAGRRWLPMAVLGAMAAVAAVIAVTAIEAGDPRGAIGPLLMLAFVAFEASRHLAARRQRPADRRS